MRELFVEKVIEETTNFLDNNQRIKLKEILTEICLSYQIEILKQSQKQEIQKNNEEILNIRTINFNLRSIFCLIMVSVIVGSLRRE